MSTSKGRLPSVKGSLFAIVQANLQALLERDKITREELEIRLAPELSPEAMAAVGRVSARKIIDSGLYPQLEDGAAPGT